MKKILFLLPLAILTSCALAPDYRRPAQEVPAAWREAAAANETDLAAWWKKFQSPELAELQARARAQNLDLKAAADRVLQARANEKIASAALLPQAALSGSVSGTQSRIAGRSLRHGTAGGVSTDVSYDLDLFGANRAARDVAKAGVDSSVFDREALQLIVSAEVATTYATVLALKGRIAVAEQSRSDQKKTLTMLEARFAAGAVSALEVEQQKTAVATSDASIAALKTSLAAATDALAVLVGAPPQTFGVKADSLSTLSAPAIAPGQPSALLERRPDIAEAEANLVAANADIGVARAAFFPSLNLSANAGVAASQLADPATTALGIAAGLTAPLFRGGSLEGGLEKARARQSELAETYRKSVLIAFQETEDALAAVEGAKERRAAYTRAATAAQKAYDLAEQRFKAGGIDELTLLDSQRSLLSAKDSLVQANLDSVTAAVGLYKALGGGWLRK
jgi:multidrug efflux system outer membrane protein